MWRGWSVPAPSARWRACCRQPDADSLDESPRRAALLAALNGVVGDRMAASGNPLATQMSLRLHGRPLHLEPLPATLAPRVLLLVHGLCMNELQWQPAPPQRGHADALAPALGAEVVGLRYNSGRHVAHNGRELALQLERLLGHWPVPLQSISVLAHSMGGLVMRSALHQAQQLSMQWPQRLRHLVFLGTPHHGAPLERAGNFVDGLLGGNLYSAPFAALAQLRSAGITDLRHGALLDRRRSARGPLRARCRPAHAGAAAHRRGLLRGRRHHRKNARPADGAGHRSPGR